MSAPPAGGGGGGSGGIVSELKRRLGDSFSLLHAVSIRYQRGEATAEEYYELGLDILAGDAASLFRLVDKLPDAEKREAVQRCHEAAVAELEQQLLLEEQQAEEDAAAAVGARSSNGRQRDQVAGSHDAPAAAAAASASQLLPADVYTDEQDDAELDDLLGQSSSGSSGGQGRLCGNRMWGNADGQPLGQVIHRFLPPWQEAAQGGASGRPGTYQQLAAARKLGSRSGGSGSAPVVPSSTPWVQPGAPIDAPTPQGAGIAAASMSALSLEPPRLRSRGSAAAAPPAAAGSASASSVASGSRRPAIVWLRRDLRLADNPAVHAAAASGRPVLPVFIWAVSLAGKPVAALLPCRWTACYADEDVGCKYGCCLPSVSPPAAGRVGALAARRRRHALAAPQPGLLGWRPAAALRHPPALLQRRQQWLLLCTGW